MVDNELGRAKSITRGLELDLRSDQRTIVLGKNLFKDQESISILVGERDRLLTSGSRVTPAEYVALNQMLSNDKQVLKVDGLGQGVEGKFSLDGLNDAGRRINATTLVIPENVSSAGNFSGTKDIKITGSLINFGSVFAFSDKNSNVATVSASNVENHDNAVITNSMPSSEDSANLIVSAKEEIENAGRITSTGSLKLSGSKVANHDLISARSTIEIDAPDIVNTGTIESTDKNVFVNPQTRTIVSIDNTGGTISAVKGNIEIRDQGFSKKLDTSLKGGDWISKELNIHSGKGNIFAHVKSVSGAVSAYGGIVNVNADSSALNMVKVDAHGDPLIQNTGDVILGSVDSFGGPITVVAGQNILITSGTTLNSNGLDGGDILLVAGVDYSIDGIGNLTITNQSLTGGNIQYTGTGPIIRTDGVHNAGDLTLIAFASPDGTTNGAISLADASISTRGGPGFTNGNVTAIAGGGMEMGYIDAKAPDTLGAGNVTLSSFNPTISGIVKFDPNGAQLSGSFETGAGFNKDIILQKQIYAFSGSFVANSSGRFNNNDAISAANINIQALDSINLNAPLFAQDGTVSLTTNNADINQLSDAKIRASTLNVHLLGPSAGTAHLDNAANQTVHLNGFGSGQISIASDDLFVGDLGSTQGISINAPNGLIVFSKDITTNQVINLTSRELRNEAVITSPQVNLIGTTGFLTIGGGENGGTFFSEFNATTTSGNLTLVGTIDFQGVTTLDASGPDQSIIVSSGAVITGHQLLQLNAPFISLPGTISGQPLVLNTGPIGTIANGTGDVNLSGDVRLAGGDIAVIAAGNINGTGIRSFDLTLENGDSGSLTLIAGYKFDPAVDGQILDSATTFTDFQPNEGIGGSINLSGVDANLSGDGAGGKFVAVAYGSIVNAGSIDFGNIDTRGTTVGGDVTIFATGGIDLADIITTAPTAGNIQIALTQANQSNSLQIKNGTLTGHFFSGASRPTSGDINLGRLNAGTGTIGVTNRTSTGAIRPAFAPVAHKIWIENNTGLIDLTAMNGISATPDELGRGGFVELFGFSIKTGGSQTSPFEVHADAVGNAEAGSTSVELLGTQSVYVGNVPKASKAGEFFIASALGSGHGLIEFDVAGNLTVDSSGIIGTNGVDQGPTIYLASGLESQKNGNLVITGNLESNGPISIADSSKKAFVIGADKVGKNGVFGTISSSNSIIVSNDLGGIVFEASDVLFTPFLNVAVSDKYGGAGGDIKSRNGAVIVGERLTLSSEGGRIGGSGKPVEVLTQNLNVQSYLGSASIHSVGSAPLVFGNSSVNGDFSLTCSGPLDLNNLTSKDGEIVITVSSGKLSLADGAKVLSHDSLLIQNTDLVSGQVEFGNATRIESGFGKSVIISIGTPPKKFTNTVPPPNVSVNAESDKAAIYFEPTDGVVSTIGSSVAVRKGYALFSNASSSGQKIMMNSSITVGQQLLSGSSSSQSDALSERSYSVGNLFPGPDSLLSGTSTRSESNNSKRTFEASPFAPHVESNLKIGIYSTEDGLSSTIASTFAKVSTLSTNQILPVVLSSGENYSNTPALLDMESFTSTSPPASSADAFVWCDQDLGLESASLLKKSKPEEADMKAQVKCGAEGNRKAESVTINRGAILMVPSHLTRVQTRLGTVEFERDCLALLIVDDDKLAVYDLHDSKKDSIRIQSGGEQVSLSPGKCIVITSRVEAAFENANPIETIAYKSVDSLTKSNGSKHFRAQFSTTSAMSSVQSLSEIITSKHPHAKKLRQDLIKTTAVLMHLDSDEAYCLYQQNNSLVAEARTPR